MSLSFFASEFSVSNEFPNDEISLLQLRIARRADELARQAGPDQAKADFWQRAEFELIDWNAFRAA
jgi:hypothetical protein